MITTFTAPLLTAATAFSLLACGASKHTNTILADAISSEAPVAYGSWNVSSCGSHGPDSKVSASPESIVYSVRSLISDTYVLSRGDLSIHHTRQDNWKHETTDETLTPGTDAYEAWLSTIARALFQVANGDGMCSRPAPGAQPHLDYVKSLMKPTSLPLFTTNKTFTVESCPEVSQVKRLSITVTGDDLTIKKTLYSGVLQTYIRSFKYYSSQAPIWYFFSVSGDPQDNVNKSYYRDFNSEEFKDALAAMIEAVQLIANGSCNNAYPEAAVIGDYLTIVQSNPKL